MTVLQQRRYTFKEYEEFEKEVDARYEYRDGEIFKLTETTKRQNTIVLSFSSLLHPVARKNGCAVFINSIKLKLKTGEKYVYPDVIYTCEPADLADDSETVVQSPSLLIEVFSESSHRFDIQDKRLEYFKIPSLQYYLLVSQKHYGVELYERSADFWKYTIYDGLDAKIELEKLGVTMSLAEIYEGI
ncbi:Uma2 family endonuclease [Larkinella humicola]|uniref:Uma2 family endonuclease n=1 Tax=Larkinella humicola TaxID=2607654 RepID=A0A5N1JL03_9BACT|nr:Uma2 family endonuclease [Larkinella humicola]KAA9356196.1 Uma2 family endonuclease [Larkinella humicola]